MSPEIASDAQQTAVVLHPNAPVRRASSGSHPALRMLELPPRGDALARRWLLGGVGFYLLLSSVLLGSLVAKAGPGQRGDAFRELFGLGAHANWPLAILVLAGVVLTVAATVKVAEEIRDMRREENDVDWVQRHQRAGLLLVFADADKREALFKTKQFGIPDAGVRVETLIDDRVRRVHLAATSGGSVATNELQSVADVRTARYGGFARYASSLLLLLAVLGTFAGVKTALPSLIDAVGKTTDMSMNTLTGPLNVVAGAFGGNALALIGAIAVGLMAQGMGFGRRNLLERLELVSAEYIYGEGTSADASPLHAAVAALRDTAVQIHGATGTMAGIEGGLQSLSSDFKTALGGLGDRLHEIAERQEEGLYDRTAEALEGLQNRLGEVAKLVEASSLSHAGLVSSVISGGEESRQAIAHMREANEKLGASLGALMKLADHAQSSVDSVAAASASAVESSETLRSDTVALRTAIEQLKPALETVSVEFAQVVDRLAQSDRDGRKAWEAMIERTEAALSERPVAPPIVSQPNAAGQSPAVPQRASTSDREVLAVLNRIASKLDEAASSRPSLLKATLPVLMTTLLGGAIMFGLLRLLRV